MIIKMKKYPDSAGIEWLDLQDIFRYINESDRNFQLYYMFLKILKEFLEYYNWNTPTSFGNPDRDYLEGFVRGFCAAKQWYIDETSDAGMFCIYDKHDKKIFEIEIPKTLEENQND